MYTKYHFSIYITSDMYRKSIFVNTASSWPTLGSGHANQLKFNKESPRSSGAIPGGRIEAWPEKGDVNRFYRTTPDKEKPRKPYWPRGFNFYRMLPDYEMVEVGGVEPPSENTPLQVSTCLFPLSCLSCLFSTGTRRLRHYQMFCFAH